MAVALIAGLMPAQPVSAGELQGDAEAGRKMFDMVCRHCHNNSYDDKFGPGLKGIMERVDEAWLDAWLKDPEAMVKSDDYARGLRESNAYGMTMPRIPAMRDAKARADVIAFLRTLK